VLKVDDVIIVGGGPVGLFLTGLLAERGLSVSVYERHPDLRRLPLESVRPSLSLAISSRGLHQLEQLGLGATVERLSASAYGRLVHTSGGDDSFEQYSRDRQALHFILRSDLTEALIAKIETLPGVRLHFGVKCVGVDVDRPAIQVQQKDDARVETVEAAAIVAADGAYSTVRRHLLRTERFDYSQQYLDQGYAEITVDPNQHGARVLQPGALHVWRRGDGLLLGFPNRDGSFTLSLFLPFEGERSFAAVRDSDDLQAMFARDFPELAPLREAAVAEYFSHRPNPMVTIRCAPWVFEGRIAVIGDAAHAIVPHYGQGVTVGFEDCTCLARLVDEHGPRWPQVFAAYDRTRRPNATAIADLSLAHVHVLRGTEPADPLTARIEAHLDDIAGETLPPLYSLVAFSDVPFSEVVGRDHVRQRVIDCVRAVLTERATDAEIAAAVARIVEDHVQVPATP
jgi:kynurenine 3-monooxygenase